MDGVHYFYIDHATQFGQPAATILANIIFWIKKNKANNKHFHEGKTWTYNSYKAFAIQFPYFTEKQIRGTLEKLIEAKVIVKGNFNDRKSDQTNWYALLDEKKYL